MSTVTTTPGHTPGVFGRWFLQLFDACSTDPILAAGVPLPQELLPYQIALHRGAMPPRCAMAPTPKGLSLPAASTAVVGFSGGKDSTAAALKLRERGLAVHLVHVTGLNRSVAGEEARCSRRVAEVLGMPYHEVRLHVKGSCAWTENPVRNQLVSALVLDVALRPEHGWAVHAMGGLLCDQHQRLTYGGGWSDTELMFTTFADSVGQIVGGYQYVRALLKNDTDSLATIVRLAPHVLPEVRFCMLPSYRRPTTRRANERKFGAECLLPNRCGTCYKCCLEYLQLATWGTLPANPAFAQHCVKKIKTAIETIVHPGYHYTEEECLRMRIDFDVADVRPLLGWAV